MIADLIAEIWRRATSVQPIPPPAVVALTAVAALALVMTRAVWPYTRVLVTITHEAGHAVVALLAGRQLEGIRLHSDASGLTVSSGRASGPGMVAMLLAGYLAPALVGLGAGGLLISGFSLGLLWLLVILLAVMLLQIRNFAGFGIVVVVGAALVAVSWYAPAPVQSGVAYLVTWILLLSAPKPVLELIRMRRYGRAPHSDADQLARLTRVPAELWIALFLVLNGLGLLLGVALLLPAVVDVLVELLPAAS
ncbi:MAG TPA: M50 family metallopeptidase [Propionibacteriaceae bacterium]|nr:M50 family metallopeptidase [Propionibacteriaceae bacterium]